MTKLHHAKAAQKDYWFYIETYVHISMKKDSLLLYNTFTGTALEYSGNTPAKVFALVRRLLHRGNLWIIRLSINDLKDPEIGGFVQAVRSRFMGDLLGTSWSDGKPVQTVPIVTIEKSVERLKGKDRRSVGEGLMEHLSELFFYINSRCSQDCRICQAAYKQFPCCTRAKGGSRELSTALIETLLIQVTASSISKINIHGGDITEFKELNKLVHLLEKNTAKKTYVVHYKNMAARGERLGILTPGHSHLKIPVTFPLDKASLEAALEVLGKIAVEATFCFIIQSEAEYDAAEALISTLAIPDYTFLPFFNGENLEFFQQNVFFEKDEILQSKPSLRDIYQNGEVNSLNFGRLSVFGNRHLHANPNAPRLGILGKDSIYDVLYNELYRGKSWRRVRKHQQPCKGCTFREVCPPLSNYTHALGRNDLCFKGISQQPGEFSAQKGDSEQ